MVQVAELGAYAQDANESWRHAGTKQLICITGFTCQWCEMEGGNESCAAFETVLHECMILLLQYFRPQCATAKTVKMVCIQRVFINVEPWMNRFIPMPVSMVLVLRWKCTDTLLKECAYCSSTVTH